MQDYKKEAAEFVIWKSAISRQSMKIVFEILQHETGGFPQPFVRLTLPFTEPSRVHDLIHF